MSYPDKKFGRAVVFTESILEPVYYSLIDKNEEITAGKLTKDTLIVIASGGNFNIVTISDFLEGNKKIMEEMEGAKYA